MAEGTGKPGLILGPCRQPYKACEKREDPTDGSRLFRLAPGLSAASIDKQLCKDPGHGELPSPKLHGNPTLGPRWAGWEGGEGAA